MKWFTVSVSDSVRAVDSQSAVARFLESLKNKSAQTIAKTFEVSVEEDKFMEDKFTDKAMYNQHKVWEEAKAKAQQEEEYSAVESARTKANMQGETEVDAKSPMYLDDKGQWQVRESPEDRAEAVKVKLPMDIWGALDDFDKGYNLALQQVKEALRKAGIEVERW